MAAEATAAVNKIAHPSLRAKTRDKPRSLPADLPALASKIHPGLGSAFVYRCISGRKAPIPVI